MSQVGIGAMALAHEVCAVKKMTKGNSRTCRSRIIPDRFVEEGDVVAGLGRTEVRRIDSGEIAHEGESAGVFWFRDGKIVRWQPFETNDAALNAAGLPRRTEG